MEQNTSFQNMAESKKEDWDLIIRHRSKTSDGMPDQLLTLMKQLEQNQDGYPVDRLEHSLQTADLAAQDGRDDEYIVCALLHDIGDLLGIYNHADISAAVVEPFVSEANHWMVKHHAIFQGYNFFHHIGLDRNMRDRYKNAPYYEYTDEFVQKYDNPAFNADRTAPTLEHFAPLVRKIMMRPARGMLRELTAKQ